MSATQLTTPKIFLYQYVTLGFYFLVWCYGLGKSLDAALQHKIVPTLWWFIVPGGAYYWVWRFAEALDIATDRQIKKVDSFLLYLLLTAGVFGGVSYIPQLHASVLVILAILLVITLHAIFISIIQSKLNKIRGGSR